MLKPSSFGFSETFTVPEQYQILADLITIARHPQQRANLVAHCRIPDGFFTDLLGGNFSAWSKRPAEPLFLASTWTLNRLYHWFRLGFKPMPAEMVQAYAESERRDGGHLSTQLASTLWLWFEQTLNATLPGLAPPASPQDVWRLRVQPLKQTLLVSSRRTSAIMLTMTEEKTGHLLAYRILPAHQQRNGWHWALHDALALQKSRPAEVLVETSPPASWRTSMYNLTIPFRQHDIFRWVSHDPAWENAMMRLALPESKTYVYSGETLHFDGHIYHAQGNVPSLLPVGTPVTLRLSACSTHYGWVYHAKKLLTNVFRSDIDDDPAYLHQFRDWEEPP